MIRDFELQMVECGIMYPENSHHWGKYHSKAGLQFYKFG